MQRFLGRRLDGYGELFESGQYPATCDEVVAAYGNLVFEHPDGSTETLGEVLGRISPDVLETPSEAMTAIASAVSEGAVGRKAYTDRDPPVPGTYEFTVTQESF